MFLIPKVTSGWWQWAMFFGRGTRATPQAECMGEGVSLSQYNYRIVSYDWFLLLVLKCIVPCT